MYPDKSGKGSQAHVVYRVFEEYPRELNKPNIKIIRDFESRGGSDGSQRDKPPHRSSLKVAKEMGRRDRGRRSIG